MSFPGTGPFGLPNWDDFTTFPSTRIYLFQPGINTWEFLVGDNETNGAVYIDPVTGSPVDQAHGGSSMVASGTLECTSCHAVRKADGANSMEELAAKRGGVWSDTPVD